MRKYKWALCLLLALLAGCDNENEIQELPSAATNTELLTEPIEAEDSELAEEFSLENLILLEDANPYAERSENILTAKEAAQMMAYYIWEMFGVNINGRVLNISYTSPLALARSYWHGMVAEDEETLEELSLIFMLMIDAYTGERIDIINFYGIEPRPWGYEGWPVPSIEESEAYMEIARGYAQAHFDFTEVESIELHPTWAFNPAGTLTFLAADERGRVADITIQLGTGRLMTFLTQSNDIDGNLQVPSGGIG